MYKVGQRLTFYKYNDQLYTGDTEDPDYGKYMNNKDVYLEVINVYEKTIDVDIWDIKTNEMIETLVEFSNIEVKPYNNINFLNNFK